MRALSIRQPYAELILRGEKTIEYRSRPTRLIGQRFYIYAARKWAGVPAGLGLETAGICGLGQADLGRSPQVSRRSPCKSQAILSLPTGFIVGSAVISKCVEVRSQMSEVSHNGSNGHTPDLTSDPPDCPPTSALYEWYLQDVRRFKKPRKPTR